MANADQIVKDIKELETIEEYIKRYTDEELRNIRSNPTSYEQFCAKLLIISSGQLEQRFESEEYQRIWRAVKNLNNYGRIRYFVEMLKPARNDLLKTLETNAKCIEQYTKFALYVKLMGSVGDIAGTVGDFLTRGSSSDYSNYALTADVLGFLGDATPLAEAYLSFNAYDDAVKKIQKDQELFTPIQQYFQQSKELEEAVLEIFPFDFKGSCLKGLYDAADKELRGARLLESILENIIKDSIQPLRDGMFMENLTSLFVNSLIEEVIELLKIRPSQIPINILRMDGRLMIDNFIKIGLRQLKSKLPQKHHNSYFVWPRIGLNIWSILQAIKYLRKVELSEVATEMRKLKQHLKGELDALERILNYIESRRKE